MGSGKPKKETSPPNRGEHCGGCRRSNSTERPHAFQVILTERPPLELSANDEQDMAEWMQLLCQSVSKGVTRLVVAFKMSVQLSSAQTRSNPQTRALPGHPSGIGPHPMYPMLPGGDQHKAADLPSGLSDQLLPLAGQRRRL